MVALSQLQEWNSPPSQTSPPLPIQQHHRAMPEPWHRLWHKHPVLSGVSTKPLGAPWPNAKFTVEFTGRAQWKLAGHPKIAKIALCQTPIASASGSPTPILSDPNV